MRTLAAAEHAAAAILAEYGRPLDRGREKIVLKGLNAKGVASPSHQTGKLMMKEKRNREKRTRRRQRNTRPRIGGVVTGTFRAYSGSGSGRSGSRSGGTMGKCSTQSCQPTNHAAGRGSAFSHFGCVHLSTLGRDFWHSPTALHDFPNSGRYVPRHQLQSFRRLSDLDNISFLLRRDNSGKY